MPVEKYFLAKLLDDSKRTQERVETMILRYLLVYMILLAFPNDVCPHSLSTMDNLVRVDVRRCTYVSCNDVNVPRTDAGNCSCEYEWIGGAKCEFLNIHVTDIEITESKIKFSWPSIIYHRNVVLIYRQKYKENGKYTKSNVTAQTCTTLTSEHSFEYNTEYNVALVVEDSVDEVSVEKLMNSDSVWIVTVVLHNDAVILVQIAIGVGSFIGLTVVTSLFIYLCNKNTEPQPDHPRASFVSYSWERVRSLTQRGSKRLKQARPAPPDHRPIDQDDQCSTDDSTSVDLNSDVQSWLHKLSLQLGDPPGQAKPSEHVDLARKKPLNRSSSSFVLHWSRKKSYKFHHNYATKVESDTKLTVSNGNVDSIFHNVKKRLSSKKRSRKRSRHSRFERASKNKCVLTKSNSLDCNSLRPVLVNSHTNLAYSLSDSGLLTLPKKKSPSSNPISKEPTWEKECDGTYLRYPEPDPTAEYFEKKEFASNEHQESDTNFGELEMDDLDLSNFDLSSLRLEIEDIMDTIEEKFRTETESAD